MGLKLVHTNSNPILRASTNPPRLVLIAGEKDTVQLWPGDQQSVPLPKIIEKDLVCHGCQSPEMFTWINSQMIYCFMCQLTSIQRHDVSEKN